MVICRYFLQGACRFGSKCNNDHIDITQTLITDADTAIKGKMWPLSCYGPFKDKPSIPNFVDQSFEEVRFMCYESKRQNYYEQFHQHFTKEVVDATNKIKTLLQPMIHVIDVVIKIHDTPTPATSASLNNNPFGYSNTNANAAANNSIFSKPVNSSNIFGGGSNVNNNSNVFGGGSVATANPSSIFGGATAASNSVFPQQQHHQSSLFLPQSQQQQPQQPANQGSIFGQQQRSVFNQPATQPFQSGNMFPQAANTNPFGQTTMINNSMFPQQQQQPTQQQMPGPFGQVAAPAPNPSNFFVQAAQQQPQPPPTGFFGQAANALSQQQPQMQTNVQHATAQGVSSVYTPMESLTAEEIEAFKADSFTPGKLPFSPPPHEFIT